MTALIATVPKPPPPVEYATVTALRGQLARGASAAVLVRIAGGLANYRRLAKEYGLPPMRVLHAAPPRPMPERVTALAPPVRKAAPVVVRAAPPLPPAPACAHGGGRPKKRRARRRLSGTAALLREIARINRELSALERWR